MPAARDVQSRFLSAAPTGEEQWSEPIGCCYPAANWSNRAQTLKGKNQCIPSVDGDFRGSLYHIEPSADFHGDWAPRWGSRFNAFHPASLPRLSSAVTHYGKAPQ